MHIVQNQFTLFFVLSQVLTLHNDFVISNDTCIEKVLCFSKLKRFEIPNYSFAINNVSIILK